MRELTLRVPAEEAERVLDAILPALPGGAHVREDGKVLEVKILESPGTPAAKDLRALAGATLIGSIVTEVSDDWRERRLARYEPLVVAGRFLLRPDWAPAGEGPGLTEIVLEQSTAFGTGLHPTTQACLATLAELGPGGSFADLGCGSGVLAIAAAMLGWGPVVAVDVDEASVASSRANASRNGVSVEALRADLTAELPPRARTVAANVPPAIHAALAERIADPPAVLVASGFLREEIDLVASTWAARGLQAVDEVSAGEWAVLVLR